MGTKPTRVLHLLVLGFIHAAKREELVRLPRNYTSIYTHVSGLPYALWGETRLLLQGRSSVQSPCMVRLAPSKCPSFSSDCRGSLDTRIRLIIWLSGWVKETTCSVGDHVNQASNGGLLSPRVKSLANCLVLGYS